MKIKSHHFLFSLIVAFTVSLPVSNTFLHSQTLTDYDRKIESRTQEIRRLISEKKDTLTLIESFKKREWRVLEILKVINDSITAHKKKLKITISKIEELQIRIRSTNKKIDALKGEIKADKKKISQQVMALFYLGKVRNMTPFIGLSSFENYFRNQRLLQNSTKLDIEILNRLNFNLKDLEVQRKKRREQWVELQQLKEAEEEQKELLDFEQQQQYTYLLHLREDRESRLKYLGEIEIELEHLNVMIYSLELERETQRKVEQFQGFRKLKKRLAPPVEGKLLHRFEQRNSIFYTLYKRGVLVETSKNEEALSILPGKVVWAGPFRGYHNLVIVDHGKGSLSVYGNLDEIYVIVDDAIDQGHALGTVAYHSLEGRYLFYFETRLNKRAINPVQWLTKSVWE